MRTSLKPFAFGILLTTVAGACSDAPAEQVPAGAESEAEPADTAAQANVANGSPSRQPSLLEGELEGIATAEGDGVDSVVYIADFPPGSISSHHSHPGWEYNYILEGAVTFEVDGQEPFTRRAGEAMYNPRGNSHTVKNASQTDTAKLVSVLIKEEGAPVAIDVP